MQRIKRAPGTRRRSAHGWFPGARRVLSPNADERSGSQPVDLLVIHNISLPPGRFGGPAVEALFTNRIDPAAHPFFAQLADLKVSAHFFVRRNGRIVQFVDVHRRAWHAGVSTLVTAEGRRERCNDFSVGIEFEGTDHQPFTMRQYAAGARLARWLRRRLPLAFVRGHSEIAPGRKTDPGPYFDWMRFMRDSGFSVEVRPALAEMRR
ncbi:MAG TPA: 1,6-anhydro-N-acetylmuramyl-L-alanine amidase AmpD [Burkholderiaceae bacterium]|nr:1,6-anhydro-N-acetylmuramyl-L-alanine amidase AmpD [Burkholderiaceae bacterium]